MTIASIKTIIYEYRTKSDLTWTPLTSIDGADDEQQIEFYTLW